MARTYSLYEAKARLSEIIRLVRERRESVIVSYHGEPVAEIRPIGLSGGDTSALEQRVSVLYVQGIVSAPAEREFRAESIAKRPGALKRFLEDRD